MNAMPATECSDDGVDLELPPVWTSTMDHVELLAWAKDVKSLCHIEEVRVKGAPELMSDAAHAFSEAMSQLICHHVAALQVRYVYEGKTYFDTCLSEQGSFRLVRVLLQSHPVFPGEETA